MTSLELHQNLKATVGVAVAVALVAVVCVPTAAFPQGVSEVDPASSLLDADTRLAGGQSPADDDSTDPVSSLMSTALRLEADGDHNLAIAVIEDALEVVRPTYGLHSLEQAPLLQRLIVNEEARGNFGQAWNLEQQLLDLVRRHPNDVRAIPILRATAARREDILARYVSGGFPEQIILGCYYSPRWGRTRGGSNCRSGSRSVVVSTLLGESRRYYNDAIGIILNQGIEYVDELREIDLALARTSYRYAHFLSSYDVGRRSLLRLAALDRMNSEPLLTRTASLTYLIDWDLLFVDGATRKSREERTDTVVARYEGTYERLRSDGAPQASIDSLFAPEIPVVLPAFLPNPLATMASPGASPRYIDVSFVVTRFGNGDRIEVLDTTANATDAEKDTLIDLIESSRFRPRATNGRFVDTAPIVVRYHLNR